MQFRWRAAGGPRWDPTGSDIGSRRTFITAAEEVPRTPTLRQLAHRGEDGGQAHT
jgi:hypothetical protein